MSKKHRVEDDGWGFTESEARPNHINQAEYDKCVRQYHAPIKQHTCDSGCAGPFIIRYHHEQEEIFDDFELSQWQRERMDSELRMAKGRESREKLALRRFPTNEGTYMIRLESPDPYASYTRRMGDIEFESEEEQIEYFNYALKVFQFTEVERAGKDEPFFDDDPTEWVDEDEWVDEEDEWDNW